MSDYRKYLKTLRRVPDEIILSVGTRGLKLDDGNACLCGWFVREAIARIRNEDAARVNRWVGKNQESDEMCSELYGGTEDEWSEIYQGVADTPEVSQYSWTTGKMVSVPNDNYRLPEIERAFVERVLECVS